MILNQIFFTCNPFPAYYNISDNHSKEMLDSMVITQSPLETFDENSNQLGDGGKSMFQISALCPHKFITFKYVVSEITSKQLDNFGLAENYMPACAITGQMRAAE